MLMSFKIFALVEAGLDGLFNETGGDSLLIFLVKLSLTTIDYIRRGQWLLVHCVDTDDPCIPIIKLVSK